MRRLPNIRYIIEVPGDHPPYVVHRGVAESRKTGEARLCLWQRKAVSLTGIEMEPVIQIHEKTALVRDPYGEEDKPWLLKFFSLPNPSVFDRLLAPLGYLPSSALARRLAGGESVPFSHPHGVVLQAELPRFTEEKRFEYYLGPRLSQNGKVAEAEVVVQPVRETVTGFQVTITAQAREVMRKKGLVLITGYRLPKPQTWSAARIRREARIDHVL